MDSANQNLDKIGEAQLNQILLLKVTMELVPKLIEALNGADSGKLKKMKLVLHTLYKMSIILTCKYFKQ